MKAVISNRIYLQNSEKIDEDKLRETLTYLLPGHYTTPDEPIRFCNLLKVNKNIFSIPSGRTDLIPEGYSLKDKRISNEIDNFPQFSSKLRLTKEQQGVYDIVDDSCIINAPVGWGKTFCSCAIMSKLKQKTLVIVHTSLLRDQWVEQVKKALNYDAGVIGGGKFQVDRDIVIGMIQTINNKVSEITKMFGLVIVDECHHLPATTFKTTIDKMHSRYKIGISATLTRKDRKHLMLNDFLGYNTIVPDNYNTMEPIVQVIKTEFKLPAGNVWANKITKLMANTEYQVFIQKLAEKKVLMGHKVLVVSDRVDFLHTLASRTGDISVAATSTGLTEQQKINLRDYIEEHIYTDLDIIYGSISIFKEGINLPPLSCLILATPVNNDSMLNQLIGRVVRKYEGKRQPEIIDVALACRTGGNQLLTRINTYNDLNIKVKFLN